MTPEGRSALLRGAGFAVALVLVGAAGLWTGRAVQRARRSDPPPVPAPPVPAFAAGDAFPAVPLLAEDGFELSSDRMLGERGGVVLFLDPQCPACSEAVAIWQAWLDAGALDGIALVGVSSATLEAIAAYRDDHGLGFPIYADRGGVFAGRYGVEMVPTTVLVDATGTVVFAGYQPLAELDPGDVVRTVTG